MLLDYHNFEALLTDDLEKEASSNLNRELLDEYVQGPLEVYKVSHHGSEDSHNPDLISYLNPQHCLVSVGENKFGHPSQKALDSLSK